MGKNNLKAIRQKQGYSLQKLSELCGHSRSVLWELEQPFANPTLKTAYAIAGVLGVSVTEIWPNTAEIIEETVTIRRVVNSHDRP